MSLQTRLESLVLRLAAEFKTIYGQVGQAFALVGSLVFLGLMLYIDIVQHILGKDYREGIAVVPLLLMAYLFLGLYYNFSIWYKLADRTSIGAYIAIVGAVITVSLNLWLIPQIGYLGSAWAALACYSFMAVASYLLGQRYYPIDYPMGKISLYIGMAVAAYGLSIFITADFSLASRLAINTAILALYLLLFYLIERPLLRRYFSK